MENYRVRFCSYSIYIVQEMGRELLNPPRSQFLFKVAELDSEIVSPKELDNFQ